MKFVRSEPRQELILLSAAVNHFAVEEQSSFDAIHLA